MCEIFLGPPRISFDCPQNSAIGPRLGEAWGELYGLVVIGARAVKIAFELPRRAADVVGFRIVGFDFERSVLIADRAVRVIHEQSGRAAIAVELGATRIELDSAVEIVDRARVIAFKGAGQTAMGPGSGKA